MRKLILIFLGQ